jgi:hypothetical protein
MPINFIDIQTNEKDTGYVLTIAKIILWLNIRRTDNEYQQHRFTLSIK